MLKERVVWIQNAKGIGILLIILGHVVGGGGHLASGAAQVMLNNIYAYIYSFHVPLFFFIAGLTFSAQQPLAGFLRKKAQRLLIPYFVFGLASGIIYLIFQANINHVLTSVASTDHYQNRLLTDKWIPFVGLLHGGKWPNGNGFIANSVLWFLPCLFTLEVLYYAIENLFKPHVEKKTFHLLIALCSLISGCFLKHRIYDYLPWGFSLAPFYMFYFAVAKCINQNMPSFTHFQMRTGRWWRLLLATCMILGGGYLVFHFRCFKSPEVVYLQRAAFACLSIIGWCLIAQCFRSKMIETIGGQTMGLMLMHKFPMMFIQLKIGWVQRLFAGDRFHAMVGVFIVFVFTVGTSFFVTQAVSKKMPWLLGAGFKKNY